MIDEYATDPDFKDVMSGIAMGKKEEPYHVEDGYLLYDQRLCVTKSLREKVLFDHMYLHMLGIEVFKLLSKQ